MKYTKKTEGICATQLSFELEDNIVRNVEFVNGCNGNLKAIGRLVEGMTADRLYEILQGNTCGMRGTSCADQLAKAVRESYEESRRQV